MMNLHYWEDGFLEGGESDLVLVLQYNSVLCHRLDPNLWRYVAFVGGSWPKQSNPLYPDPTEGM